ncbi:hypothetical protein C8F04DRAFT_1368731 [Mycena alexandri]|uniref:Uncharacterized protein n=1 Tax=Mycena alexandri TaxID=1745969 RepID=A0AAD6SLH3_9AGAR|nr:hypothetical protein C8F04DRAFT_1368731 [Mycena alexandri]
MTGCAELQFPETGPMTHNIWRGLFSRNKIAKTQVPSPASRNQIYSDIFGGQDLNGGHQKPCLDSWRRFGIGPRARNGSAVLYSCHSDLGYIRIKMSGLFLSKSLDQDLGKLRAVIDGLPPSCHSGRRDGPLAEYLMPTLSSTTEENPQLVFPTSSDGPYSIFNKQWERVFQRKPTDPSDKLQRLMCRGQHGLILAYSWAAHYRL